MLPRCSRPLLTVWSTAILLARRQRPQVALQRCPWVAPPLVTRVLVAGRCFVAGGCVVVATFAHEDRSRAGEGMRGWSSSGRGLTGHTCSSATVRPICTQRSAHGGSATAPAVIGSIGELAATGRLGPRRHGRQLRSEHLRALQGRPLSVPSPRRHRPGAFPCWGVSPRCPSAFACPALLCSPSDGRSKARVATPLCVKTGAPSGLVSIVAQAVH